MIDWHAVSRFSFLNNPNLIDPETHLTKRSQVLLKQKKRRQAAMASAVRGVRAGGAESSAAAGEEGWREGAST
jgi:hypothetical protein